MTSTDPSPEDADAVRATLARPRLLARNVVINIAGQAVPAVAAVVSIPFLVRGLGDSGFGFLTLVWVFLGTFSLLDLGLSRALTQLVSEGIGNPDATHIRHLTGSAHAVCFSLGLMTAVAMSVAAPYLTGTVFNMPDHLRLEARYALYAVGACAPFLIASASLRGVLEAYQRFDLVNAVRVPLGVFTFVGPVLVLPFSRSLFAVTLVLAVGRVVAWAGYAVLAARGAAGVRVSLRFRRNALRPLFRLGGWMTVSNMISPLMMYSDRFIIGAVFTTAAVAYYATPLEVATKLLLVSSAISSVAFPAFGLLARDPVRSDQLYRRAVSLTALALFPGALIVMVLARPGLALWIDPEFALRSFRVMQILAIGTFFNGLAAIPFARIQGVGRPFLTARVHLAELPVYFAVFWFLLHRYGIEGAALAWTLRVASDYVILHWLSREGADDGRSALRGHLLLTVGGGSLVLVMVGSSIALQSIVGSVLLATFSLLIWRTALTVDDRSYVWTRVSAFSAIRR